MRKLFRVNAIQKVTNQLSFRRVPRFESLESRRVMTAEGTPVAIDQIVDTSALLGTISASANWGDGTTSPLTTSNQTPTGSLRVRIDYSLDSLGFFNAADRRQLLQFAADSLVTKFADSLTAIQPSGTNTWKARVTNPSSGVQQEFNNIEIAANEIVIFAGGRDLPGNQLGEGGPGGTSSSGSTAWLNQVKSRGQAGVLASPQTDFAPWGGYIAFDTLASWHFGVDTAGLDNTEHDFYAVAVHELTHALGFGISASWNRYLQGATFVGPNAMAAYDAGGAVPLSGDLAHFQNGIADGGRETLMDPSITIGTRKLSTGLDLAALADIGWQLITPSVRITGSHIYGDNGTYLAGITLAGSQIGSFQFNTTQTITNEVPTLNDRTTVSIGAGVPLSIIDLGTFSDPGFDVPTATPPSTERFRFRIDWGDGSSPETGDATIDQLGNPNVVTRGSFDGTHTFASVGTYTVQYSTTDDDGGSATKSFVVQVTAPPSLEISIDKNIFAENAGPNAATLRVRRSGFDTAQATVVTLLSSDITELRLPATVTILAGGTEAIVAVEAVDDSLLDGTSLVNVAANFGSIQATPISVQVTDYETLTLALAASRIPENGGRNGTQLTVSRSNTDRQNPLQVSLSSSDTTEAALPGSVTIPAQAESVVVDVQAIDDDLIDGLQLVRLSAQAAGYVVGEIGIEVEDAEALSLTVTPSDLTEDSSNRRALGQVAIAGIAPANGLLITLVPSLAGQIVIPTNVLLPAGASSVQFDVVARDDFIVEGAQSIRLTATANGLSPAAVDIALADNDRPLWQNPVRPLDVDGNGIITPLDALLIINLLNLQGIGELEPGVVPPTPYVDPSGNGIVEPTDVLIILNHLNLFGIG